MRFLGRLGVATVLAMIVCRAGAETVHFSFSEAVGELKFVANPDVHAPWDGTTGSLTAFDIYYDPATLVRRDFSDFVFGDPSKSFWRARIDSDELGSFVITRPLVLRVGENSLEMSVLNFLPGTVELLDFDAMFTEQITPAWWLLPGPLLPDSLTTLTPDPEHALPSWKLDGGTSFFDIPGLQEAYGSGNFKLSQVEVLDRMSPVPESSAFATAAGAFLGALLLGRIASLRQTARRG